MVFFDFPAAKRPPKGARLLTFTTLGEVADPQSGAREGYVTQITGMMRVISRKDEAVTRAVIEQAIYDVERGQRALATDQDPDVTVSIVPATKEVRGLVLAVRDPHALVVGDEDLVFINKGKKDGLQRGNELRILGQGDRLTDRLKATEFEVGRMRVIDAQERTSTCLVIRADLEIEPGTSFEAIVQKPGAPG
jgi:hypothetical protein